MREEARIVLANFDGISLFEQADLDVLAGVGEVLDPTPLGSWDGPRASRLLGGATVLVGHWGCPMVDTGLLELAPNLGLFAYAAGTVKGTVAPEVLDRVRVTSGAHSNAEPVAEYTLAMILLANKDVLFQRDLQREPTLASARSAPEVPVGNWDKTIGVVGASLIGRRVMELLASFPALRVVLHDPYVSEEQARRLGAAKVDLDELCAMSDVVSIHAPDLPATRHMIGEAQLAAMRTGATLINTARGALLDHDALLGHVERLNVVLDVTDPEPLAADDPLRTSPTVTITPHLAGSQGTELRRMTLGVAEEVRLWASGEPGVNVITRDMLGRIA